MVEGGVVHSRRLKGLSIIWNQKCFKNYSVFSSGPHAIQLMSLPVISISTESTMAATHRNSTDNLSYTNLYPPQFGLFSSQFWLGERLLLSSISGINTIPSIFIFNPLPLMYKYLLKIQEHTKMYRVLSLQTNLVCKNLSANTEFGVIIKCSPLGFVKECTLLLIWLFACNFPKISLLLYS